MTIALDFNGDVALDETGAVASSDGFAEAVAVLLFTDARAPKDIQLLEGAERRGNWIEAAAGPFGSLIWTLKRELETPEAAEKARGYVHRALKPILDSAVPPFRDAIGLETRAQWLARGFLGVEATFVMRNGSRKGFAFEINSKDGNYLIRGRM